MEVKAPVESAGWIADDPLVAAFRPIVGERRLETMIGVIEKTASDTYKIEANL